MASFVQHTESTATINVNGGSTAAFGASTTTGNTILVTIRTANVSVLTSVTVGGQSCTLVDSQISTNPLMFVYKAENITGAAGVTATVVWAGTDTYAWICADEYNFVPTSNVVDTHYVGTGNTTSDLTVTGITTNAAAETVFVIASQANFATMSAGTDFTLRQAAIVLAGGIEDYKPAGTLSGYTAHFTSSVTDAYTMIVVTLKTTGGGGGGTNWAPMLGNKWNRLIQSD